MRDIINSHYNLITVKQYFCGYYTNFINSFFKSTLNQDSGKIFALGINILIIWSLFWITIIYITVTRTGGENEHLNCQQNNITIL